MTCKVISVVDDTNRAHQLERSLKHFGWDYEIIQASWRGFGTKLNKTNEYLHANPDVKEFIFLDGYDTFVLGTPEQIMPHFTNVNTLISGEVNCWPDADRYTLIDEVYEANAKYKFRFPNSGSYYMRAAFFKNLMGQTSVHDDMDDQRIMTDWVLSNNMNIDVRRNVFQTLCGILPTDLDNGITDLGAQPLIIHGNGKAKMETFYNLI